MGFVSCFFFCLFSRGDFGCFAQATLSYLLPLAYYVEDVLCSEVEVTCE